MRKEWETFTCDRCGKTVRARIDDHVKNGSWLQIYSVETTICGVDDSVELCGIECCRAYINEQLDSAPTLYVSRKAYAFYDEEENVCD